MLKSSLKDIELIFIGNFVLISFSHLFPRIFLLPSESMRVSISKIGLVLLGFISIVNVMIFSFTFVKIISKLELFLVFKFLSLLAVRFGGLLAPFPKPIGGSNIDARFLLNALLLLPLNFSTSVLKASRKLCVVYF